LVSEVSNQKLESSISRAANVIKINDFLDSLLFHRKIAAVPFTPVRGYGKQTIWARRSNDLPFAACQLQATNPFLFSRPIAECAWLTTCSIWLQNPC
jgi:hypothetical protein